MTSLPGGHRPPSPVSSANSGGTDAYQFAQPPYLNPNPNPPPISTQTPPFVSPIGTHYPPSLPSERLVPTTTSYQGHPAPSSVGSDPITIPDQHLVSSIEELQSQQNQMIMNLQRQMDEIRMMSQNQHTAPQGRSPIVRPPSDIGSYQSPAASGVTDPTDIPLAFAHRGPSVASAPIQYLQENHDPPLIDLFSTVPNVPPPYMPARKHGELAISIDYRSTDIASVIDSRLLAPLHLTL